MTSAIFPVIRQSPDRAMLFRFTLWSNSDLIIDPPNLARSPIHLTNGGSMKFLASMTRIGSLILMITGPAWSQSFTAAVRGVVTDPTGAAVSDAKVIITEAERNVQRLITTDAQGRYHVSALPPGQYTMTVEANGFRR